MAVELDPQLMDILACPSRRPRAAAGRHPRRPRGGRPDLHRVRPRRSRWWTASRCCCSTRPSRRRRPARAAPDRARRHPARPTRGRWPPSTPAACCGRRPPRVRRSASAAQGAAEAGVGQPGRLPAAGAGAAAPAGRVRLGGRTAHRAARPGGPVPVVLADTTPSWIGPLDVVVAHTADAADVELADSVALAVRRGAEVVLSAPGRRTGRRRGGRAGSGWWSRGSRCRRASTCPARSPSG